MQKRRDVRRIHEELEELFADLWQVPGFAGLRQGFRPNVDCYRTDDPPGVTVVVDLPGIDPDQLSIQVTERTVLISGVRRRPQPNCRVSYRQMEIEYGPFQRQIRLAEDVDPEKAHARFERGVLTIELPVVEQAHAGRFRITVERID